MVHCIDNQLRDTHQDQSWCSDILCGGVGVRYITVFNHAWHVKLYRDTVTNDPVLSYIPSSLQILDPTGRSHDAL